MTANFTASNNASLVISDGNIKYQKTTGYLELTGDQNKLEDSFGTRNQTIRFADETSTSDDNAFVTNYEKLIAEDIFRTEAVAEHASRFKMTSASPRELIMNFSRQQELTIESQKYLTITPQRGLTESPESVLSEVHRAPGYNASSQPLLLYADLSNNSQIYMAPPVNESFSNSTSNYMWLYGTNSTLININSLSSSEPSSFTFDLTPWLTLTPANTLDNEVVFSDNVDSETTLILKVILLGLISLIGSLGNVLVIWSVVKERHLHRPPFYFLLSLGVTDLSRAVFCVPVVITTVLHESRWRHGESACKLFAFATSFFVFSSALSLLAIAIDRHIFVICSKTYRRRASGIANLLVAIIIWIIAFSISFPPVLGVGEYVFIPEEAQCAYHHKHYTLNGSISVVLVFLAIIFLTYLLYFRIFRFLRAHRRMRPLQHTPAISSNWAFVGPGANGQAFINWLNGFSGQVPIRQGGQSTVQRLNFGRVVNLSIAKNEHLTRLFLTLTLVFGITWLPYVILSLWRILLDATIIPSSFVTVSAWLGYGQLAVCPVVYLMARGPTRKPTRTVYARAEKRNFLLENKVGK